MNLLVVDDRTIFAQALSALIHQRIPQSMVNVCDFDNVEEQISKVDLILLVAQKNGSTNELSLLSNLFARTPTICLVEDSDLDLAHDLIESGAKGVVLGSYSVAQMLTAIRQCHQGFMYVPSALSEYTRLRAIRQRQLLLEKKRLGLTQRQLEVLCLLHRRLSNREIAEHLFVSLATVKTHVNRIYNALRVGNRRDCLIQAESLGLVAASDQLMMAV